MPRSTEIKPLFWRFVYQLFTLPDYASGGHVTSSYSMFIFPVLCYGDSARFISTLLILGDTRDVPKLLCDDVLACRLDIQPPELEDHLGPCPARQVGKVNLLVGIGVHNIAPVRLTLERVDTGPSEPGPHTVVVGLLLTITDEVRTEVVHDLWRRCGFPCEPLVPDGTDRGHELSA